MTDHALCPGCGHANPPENRFCGWCGAPFEASSDLVVRREDNVTMMGHTLPAKLGPAGKKALAVGLGTLAAQVGLSWLRHRGKAEDRTSTPSTREPDTAASERLLGQSLEEVLIQELKRDHRSRIIAWRASRSFVVREPTDRRA